MLTKHNLPEVIEAAFIELDFRKCKWKIMPLLKKVFLDVLNKPAPLKKKVVRVNHASDITKTFKKTIMKQSYLERVYFRKETPDSLIKLKKQKNYCSRLYKKERKKYFESLNPKRISDNKSFWKNIQPFFSEKRKISNKITLVDNKENTLKTIWFQRNLINFSKMQPEA